MTDGPDPATTMRTVRELARGSGFSGVVRIDPPSRPGEAGPAAHEFAAGLADRAHGIPVTPGTRFGVASGSKGFTALVIASLIEDGTITLATTARSLLGGDLPEIADDVTVEHLLGHTSGIGDYLDEDELGDVDDYALPGSMHELATTEAFVPILSGHPRVFGAGERFDYCNGGFVVLALIAERAAGTDFHTLVEERVTAPAGMASTAYLRSDTLPGDAALGYVRQDGEWRSNVFHLPVRGNGDGGAYSTAADLHRFWRALFEGRIVGRRLVDEFVRPRNDVPSERKRYGLGFWLHASSRVVMLDGLDAGASFRSEHDPVSGATVTVIANTARGAWPVLPPLEAYLEAVCG